MNYYVMKNNVQQGPFSEEDMEVMYIARRLPGSTPVWYEGSENWIRFCDAPVFEAFKSRKRRNAFLCMISLPIITIPLGFIPFLCLLKYLFELVLFGYMGLFGWREIVSVTKNIKNSDNKKYDIFLLYGGLFQIICEILVLSIRILVDSKCISSPIVVRVICWSPLLLWVVLAIYSGGWKEILSAWRKIFFAFKKARVLTQQFK